MVEFGQTWLLPFLIAAVSGWPHPYPWLQTIVQYPRSQYKQPTYPYVTMDLQNNPFLSGIYQNSGMFLPNTNYIVGQLPFNIHGHPAYVNEPYFIGYRPIDIDWDKVTEVHYGGFGNNGSDKPDKDKQDHNNGGEHVDEPGDTNKPYGHDKDPHVNDNKTPGADGAKPQEVDEDLPIDPRKDEAKYYNKPH